MTDPPRQPPPPSIVAAAEQDYQTGRNALTDLTTKVRDLLEQGYTDFQAVAEVWLAFRLQKDSPLMILAAAIAVVEHAKSQPRPLDERP